MSGFMDKAKGFFNDSKEKIEDADIDVPDSVKEKLPDQVNEFLEGDEKETDTRDNVKDDDVKDNGPEHRKPGTPAAPGQNVSTREPERPHNPGQKPVDNGGLGYTPAGEDHVKRDVLSTDKPGPYTGQRKDENRHVLRDGEGKPVVGEDKGDYHGRHRLDD